jgi:release factor glutamine methyltransferase
VTSPHGPPPRATLPWGELRAEGLRQLRAAGIDGPEVELRWMVEQATGRSPAEQVAVSDAPVTEREVRAFGQMLVRRLGGEPLQYVLGRWGFRTLDLFVDGRVLIPRPETEVVAGHAVDAAAALDRPAVAVDLGTGSGAIALSLAGECWPHVEVWATDASADALAVARANLAGLGRRASAVRLAEGDWYGALPTDLHGRVDVVVSNPPYVAATDPLPAEVAEWEPADALVSGPTGLEAIEVVVGQAPTWLAEGGTLVVEIGETQGPAAIALALQAGLREVEVHPDLAGRPRALVAHR